MGRFAEAQLHYEAVLREDPFSQQVNRELNLLLIYRKMWQEARDHIQVQIRRENNKEHWQLKLAETGYLEHGDLQEYIGALEKLPTTSGLQLMQSFLSRDLKSALELFDSGARIPPLLYREHLRGNAGHFHALLLYEAGEKSDSYDYAKQSTDSIRASLSDAPGFSTFPYLAILASIMGDFKSMDNAISEARKLCKNRRYTTDFRRFVDTEMWIAMAYLISGDEDKAIEALEAADEKSGPFLFNRELPLWFIFDRLRGNPRFDALLE